MNDLNDPESKGPAEMSGERSAWADCAGTAALLFGWILLYQCAGEQLVALDVTPGVAWRLAAFPAFGIAFAAEFGVAAYCGRPGTLDGWKRTAALILVASALPIACARLLTALSDILYRHTGSSSRLDVGLNEGMLLVLVGAFLLEVRALRPRNS